MSLTAIFIIRTHITNSSSIIEDVQYICQTGLAALAIFYCDFRDTTKQNARNLVSSLLIQLCHQSHAFSQVLLSIYSAHNYGSQQPSIDVLLDCLKTILTIQGQGTIFIVLDALDECPNSFGLPTKREQVLKVVKELIDLNLPNLRLCVTSRPEIDIRRVFEPLNPYVVSLHDQEGQIKDVAEYVKSVIHSDATMGNWPERVKESVINTIAKNVGGTYVIMAIPLLITFSCNVSRFQWAFCQLETLRRCPLRYISSTLKGLPITLDETYERTLLGIPERMRKDAHSIFQWLAVSFRPLGVEELAEVFVIDFDEETFGIPNFEPSWRDRNAETAVKSTCSTLVSIVNIRGQNVAQFPHFSAQEYMTSYRIANSASVSNFHVLPKPAHALLARACLSILLRLDDTIDEIKIQNFPLAQYAAENWVKHAQFEDVYLDIRDGVDYLFDKNKPHFVVWTWLYNMDDRTGDYHRPPHPTQLDAVPLYYAVLCGFLDPAERLLDAHPQDINACGGYHKAPLTAALHKGHPNIALFLLERGADAGARCCQGQTALYMASSRGYLDVVRSLLGRGANPNVKRDEDDVFGSVKWTPLLVASKAGSLEIVRALLEHGADVNVQDDGGTSPLHIASRHPSNDLARLLLDHGANYDAVDTCDKTALHEASFYGRTAVVMSLLERGANVEARNELGWAPLHFAAREGHLQVVQLLLDRGADANAQKKDRWSPLHLAVDYGHVEVAKILLNHGADPHAQTDKGNTAFLLAFGWNRTDMQQLLSEHVGDSERS